MTNTTPAPAVPVLPPLPSLVTYAATFCPSEEKHTITADGYTADQMLAFRQEGIDIALEAARLAGQGEASREPDTVYLAGARSGSVHEWQPIETAPKDGTDILLANEKAVSPAGWVSDVDHGAEWEGQCGMAGWWTLNGDARPPTHWIPLPSPPAISAKGQAS